MKRHVDDYAIDMDENGNVIRDYMLSHTQLVGRARAATGARELVSIDYYADNPAFVSNRKTPDEARHLCVTVWR